MTTLLQAAQKLGEQGAAPTEAERLLFEEWMKGHCWALSATWTGTQYLSDAEQGGNVDPRAMRTRQLWAAWRDRGALAAIAAAESAEPVFWWDGDTVGLQDCLDYKRTDTYKYPLYREPPVQAEPTHSVAALHDTIYECIHDHGAGKCRGEASRKQRESALSALNYLVVSHSQAKAEPVATMWREENQRLYPGTAFVLTDAGMRLPLGVRYNLFAHPVQAEPLTCVWTLDDEESGTWSSSCGELWSFIDGGPKENRVTYCHHCGKLAAIEAEVRG